MNDNQKTIAIVGGGPGGLTLARLLQSQHVQVTVYERDKDRTVRQQGATLDLHKDSGLQALKVAGLLDSFKTYYRPGADKMRITDKEGTIVFEDHELKSPEDFDQEFFRPEIDRGPLRDLLIDSLRADTIVWDAQFVSMHPAGSGWELHFKSGLTAYADLVVAADGANSKLRKYVTDIEPLYSGITIIEGSIDNPEKNAPTLNALLNGGKVFALGSEKSIIVSTKGDGSLSFYTGTKEAEDWVSNSGIDFTNRHSIVKWFKSRYSDWSSIWEELFDSDESYLIPRPMYHFPLSQHWETQPNLTLLGDAAHRMPPYTGEGVNMAMKDALELYECLINPNNTGQESVALAQYEKQMLERASEMTEATLAQTEALHSTDSLQYMLAMFDQMDDLSS